NSAINTVGAARRTFRKTLEQGSERRPDGIAVEHFLADPIARKIGAQCPTSVHIRKDQHPDKVAIVAGEHAIAQQRRKVIEDSGAQRPNADPRSGRELEIFSDAAVEHDPFTEVLWIDKAHCIPHTVKALFVECLSRKVRLAPVSRSDVRPAHTYFQFVS